MIKQLLIFSVFLFSSKTISTEPVDRLGVAGPLIFNKTVFNLSWTDHPNDNYYIQEYLPAGEKTETYNQMLTLHLFLGNIKPKEAVKQKMAELENRKKTDLTCNYQVTESPDKKEYMVDFILGESKGDLMTISEFNIYHYKQVELANKKKALLVYAYTKRAYGNGITPFLKGLRNERVQLLNVMVVTEKPSIQLADQ